MAGDDGPGPQAQVRHEQHTKNLPEFKVSDPTRWSRYLQLFNIAYKAEKRPVDPDGKRAAFLIVCGLDTLELAARLCAPRELEDVPLEGKDSIVSKLTEYFSPTVSPVTAYVRFWHTRQKAGQPVADFAAELRQQAKHCAFDKLKQEEIMDTLVLYQLVCGLQDSNLQQRLLEKPKLTLNTALETASSAETACNDIGVVRNGNSGSNTNDFLSAGGASSGGQVGAFALQASRNQSYGTQQQTTKFKCFRCAGSHKANQCNLDPAVLFCMGCSRTGHLKTACLANQGRRGNDASATGSSSKSATEAYMLDATAPTFTPSGTTSIPFNGPLGCDLY